MSHQRAATITPATVTARVTDAPPSTTVANPSSPIASHAMPSLAPAPAARGSQISSASQIPTLPPEMATTW